MEADSDTFATDCLLGEEIGQEVLDLGSHCVAPEAEDQQSTASDEIQDALNLVAPVFAAVNALPLFHKL